MISTDFAPLETKKDAQLALRILMRPWTWKKGKALPRVKNRLKKYVPKHEVFLFLTARAALYKTLEALCVKPGDEVVVVPFTCEAVIAPILAHGATPVYVDIEPLTYSIDARLIEAVLSRKTKAIILQHTYGATPIGREAIIQIARSRRICVIEDLAHGFDAHELIQNPHNTVKLFSFGRSKAISSVWGGAVATTQTTLITSLKSSERQLDQPSFLFVARSLWYKPLSVFIKITYGWGIAPITIGRIVHFTSHLLRLIMDELSSREKRLQMDPQMIKAYPEAFAQLLIPQLQTFDQIQSVRSSICSFYSESFPTLATYDMPLSRYPLTVAHRDRLVQKLRKKALYVGVWYRKLMGAKHAAACPAAVHAAETIINLPTNVSLHEAEFVVKCVKQAQEKLAAQSKKIKHK